MDPATDPNNVTAPALAGGPLPPDLATLKAEAVRGDGDYSGPPFQPWEYVILGDGSQAFYEPKYAAWFQGAAPPRMPYSAVVVADLATLKLFIGSLTANDDELLDDALAVAQEWVYERTMRCDWDHPDVQQAILMLAARLFQRRRSPEGTAGFGAEGIVVRVLASDPDINRLIERHLELTNVGIG